MVGAAVSAQMPFSPLHEAIELVSEAATNVVFRGKVEPVPILEPVPTPAPTA